MRYKTEMKQELQCHATRPFQNGSYYDLPQASGLHGSDQRRVADGYVDAVWFQKALRSVEAFRAELIVAKRPQELRYLQ
jgi:hypothetical protein